MTAEVKEGGTYDEDQTNVPPRREKWIAEFLESLAESIRENMGLLWDIDYDCYLSRQRL